MTWSPPPLPLLWSLQMSLAAAVTAKKRHRKELKPVQQSRREERPCWPPSCPNRLTRGRCKGCSVDQVPAGAPCLLKPGGPRLSRTLTFKDNRIFRTALRTHHLRSFSFLDIFNTIIRRYNNSLPYYSYLYLYLYILYYTVQVRYLVILVPYKPYVNYINVIPYIPY